MLFCLVWCVRLCFLVVSDFNEKNDYRPLDNKRLDRLSNLLILQIRQLRPQVFESHAERTKGPAHFTFADCAVLTPANRARNRQDSP
jgi:hypothetical protein